MSSKLSGVKEFLTFSRGERNGIIVLIILILLLLLAPIFYKSFVNPIPSSNPEFHTQVDSFFSSLTLKPEDYAKNLTNAIEAEELALKKPTKYFVFDPNTVSVDELVSLGLSLKQAYVVEKFRSKGGRFYEAEDFAKVYVIDSIIFGKLKPWIRINRLTLELKPEKGKDSLIKLEKTPIIVELNSADSLELVKIQGIGKVFARRIIAYRNLLGGYVNIQQLNEVYGMKPDLVNAISSQIIIDSSRLKRINLNLISYEDLRKHPYLSDYQAKAIIYYRSKAGNIKDKRELLSNKILTNDKYQSIEKYLATD